MTAVHRVDDGVVRTLTLNRADRLNALGLEDRVELLDALNASVADEHVRVLVLTGTGRVFCAGGDVRSMSQAGPETERRLAVVGDVARVLARCPKPVVTAVPGGAFGMGLALVAASDVVVTTPDASFSASFAQIGLGPDCGLSWSLPLRVGRGRARTLVLTGERIGADEAQRIGLVDRVVEPDLLHTTARDVAEQLATGAPLALARIKQIFNQDAQDLESLVEAETRSQAELLASSDFAEGRAALLDRRAPQFTGV
jgi:2-(1,2-epoxy-1,2-dihydrophenyl)acetyl-CoA isomerase